MGWKLPPSLVVLLVLVWNGFFLGFDHAWVGTLRDRPVISTFISGRLRFFEITIKNFFGQNFPVGLLAISSLDVVGILTIAGPLTNASMNGTLPLLRPRY